MLSDSQRTSQKQQLLFESRDALGQASLPQTAREVAGQILEDRERLIRSNGSAEPKFQLNPGRPVSGKSAHTPAREVPDRLITRRRDDLYEARVKAARARLDSSQPLLAF